MIAKIIYSPDSSISEILFAETQQNGTSIGSTSAKFRLVEALVGLYLQIEFKNRPFQSHFANLNLEL